MKKYFLFGAIALMVSSCKNQSTVNETSQERDSLQAVINQREQSLNDFVNSFSEVEKNLNDVAAKQNIISKSADKTGEMQQNSKDRINSEIAAINDLMEQNRKKLAELTKKLKASGNKNEQLLTMIHSLNEQLMQKDQELAELNEKLYSLNAQVMLLQTAVDTLNTTVTDQARAMNTAYYVIGSSKDLQAAKIIDRSGGLLGIGKTAKLSSNFDNSKFTKIDSRQVESIAIDGKSIKIVTTHPAGSYSLDKDKKEVIKSLVITDAKKFWSASKYLVIIKD